MVSAAIYGLGGEALTDTERDFFRDADPWGFILFRRNCESAEQVRALTDSLCDLMGRTVPILVDHEGGRVSRLSPHIAPRRPPADIFARLADKEGLAAATDAARLGGELLARDAFALGINVNCVPMVDVRAPDADDIVGDRALGETPEQVAILGRAIAEGTLAGGCLPVVKHIPGHGRATCDSHLALPRVEASPETLCAVDFAPFQALADLPVGMTAHIVFEALDPDQPATLSSHVIENIIRGQIGFEGLLMTDDLSMKALTGTFQERAARSLEAGCDLVLHCNGDMAEMVAVAAGASSLSEAAQQRSKKALAQWQTPPCEDEQTLNERFAALTKAVSLAG